jgi:hypothetical protein
MNKPDRWGSYPIIGSGGSNGNGQLETLLKVSLRETGEETGIIHKFAEDRYIAFAYERTADGRPARLHPLKECVSFSDAANALRLDHRSRVANR